MSNAKPIEAMAQISQIVAFDAVGGEPGELDDPEEVRLAFMARNGSIWRGRMTERA